MDQLRSDPLAESKSLAAIAGPGTPSEQPGTPLNDWLDLLQVSRSALLRRATTQIAAITVLGTLRDASDARRLLIGCALVAEDHDLRERVHFEDGYFRVRINRSCP